MPIDLEPNHFGIFGVNDRLIFFLLVYFLSNSQWYSKVNRHLIRVMRRHDPTKKKSNAKKIQTVINSKNNKVIWLQIDRHLRLMILWYLSKIRKITSTFLTSSSDATLLGLKRRLYYSSKNTSEILKLQKCWSDLAQNR